MLVIFTWPTFNSNRRISCLNINWRLIIFIKLRYPTQMRFCSVTPTHPPISLVTSRKQCCQLSDNFKMKTAVLTALLFRRKQMCTLTCLSAKSWIIYWQRSCFSFKWILTVGITPSGFLLYPGYPGFPERKRMLGLDSRSCQERSGCLECGPPAISGQRRD